MRRLQSRSREADPTIWIGKHGATEELIKQVTSQLKTRELVKLKLQKSALEDTETSMMAEKIATLTDSELIDVMGHTFTLYKRKQAAKTKEKALEIAHRPN